MKKIIGGLIVVSLLSRPALLNASTFDPSHSAYKVYKDKNENKIIFVLKKDEENKNQTEVLDDLLEEIEFGSRRITNLLKEKNRLIGRIDTRMYLHSRTKTTLAENQISRFTTFCSYYNEESRVLKENLEKADLRKNLSAAKKELLNKDSNYELVFDELKTVSSYQTRAIKNLSGIINAGQGVLEHI